MLLFWDDFLSELSTLFFKDSLGVFHEDSKLYREKDHTGKCPDPGVTQWDGMASQHCNVSELSPLFRTSLEDRNPGSRYYQIRA